MKRKWIILCGLSLLGFLLAKAEPLQARIITVGPEDEGYDFNTNQPAIDDANDGDEIVVAPDIYYENINFRGKNITLRSTDPNSPDIVASTIIDGMRNGSVVTFNSGEDVNCVLSGFTITNGCAHLGGGINYRASIAYSIGPTIDNCVFDNNSGEYGGGMHVDGTMIIENCIFRGNFAEVLGGGISANNSVLRNCNFVGNSAGAGGGLVSEGTSPTLVNCVFSNNSAIWHGGGIYQNVGYPVLTNCVFYKNSASEGGGMYAYDCSPVLTNCIVFGNSPNQLYALEGDLLVKYSNVQSGWPGEGNIDVDPCFAEPGRWDDDVWRDGDYHLKSQAGRWDANEGRWTTDNVTSLCIDAGDPASPIGLEPFPNGGIINIGAYGGTEEASKSYFGEPVCETIVAGDINGDCKVDFWDLALMTSHWLEQK
jgi:hypothetical protein